jgi:acetolactate synthase-1/2/3 large subunit
MPIESGATALLRSLLRHGIDTVFGLPGGQLYEFFDALYLESARVRFVGPRHEQACAYMAFGYARSTGRPSVYAVVPGPGVLNTAAALCTAYGCNAPVVCLTGQIPSASIGKGIGELHELPDQLATMRSLTKWAARIERPEDAARVVRDAFVAMLSGRPRPVSIEMAPDVMALKAEVRALDPGEPRVPQADPDAIAAAATLIAEARCPLIYVGGGAAHAAAEVRELAELAGAPVGCFRSGRGILSFEHELALNLPAAHRLWPKVDVVVGIGSRMLEPLRHWGTDPQLRIIRVDVDEVEIERLVQPTVRLHGDSAVVLRELNARLAARLGRARAVHPEVARVKAQVATDIERVQPELSYLRAIRDALPRDGILCDEITQCGFASWYAWPVYAPRQHVTCGYQGTLGFGYATALGAKVANPGRPVVAIAGDGGFMFQVQELATAVQYGIDVKVILFNSNSYANVKREQQETYARRFIGSDLRNPDFVRLAESFGMAGYRATSPAELRATLGRALAERGPALIEVPVGEMASPWEFILLPKVRGVAASGSAT